MKHTSLPWTVEAYETKRGLKCPDLYEIWGDSHKIADVPKWPCDNSARHDAAYIVEACNAYPALKALNAELVQALNRVVPWLGKMIADNGHLNAVMPNEAIRSLQMAEAALLKAQDLK